MAHSHSKNGQVCYDCEADASWCDNPPNQKFRIWAERRTSITYSWLTWPTKPYFVWVLYDPFTRRESTHPSFKHALSAMQGVLNMERFLKSSTRRR